MRLKSLGVHLLFLLFTASFTTLVKSTFACDASSDHYSDVKALNVTVRSEGATDSGRTPSTNGLAYIKVNGKNYAPQTKGFNVAVFDALSGRFLNSAAYDCAANQKECHNLGTFITELPQDTIIFLAVQESASASGKTLPTSEVQGLGAQHFGSVAENTSYALIGYKGNKSVGWKVHEHKSASSGPAEVSATILIDCSYVPLVSTTCSPFNVASQKYGGSCMSQSSSLSSSADCKYAVDGNVSSGWESSSSGVINSHIQIGFHTIFTLNKLRIQQNTAKGQQIQQLLMEFSDCSHEMITLAANNSEFQEFTFLSRRANWVKFTVQTVYGSSGGVGIQEIEFYNVLCNQKTMCDAVHLGNVTVSSRYRLLTTKFPFMVDAGEQVSVLLTSESLSTSSRYEIVIASEKNTYSILKRVKEGHSEDVIKMNTTSLIRENEMRSFWIEVGNGRVLFGSGEKVHLFWRDAEPIKVKYAFLSTTDSAATFHICGRIGQCYKDAAHFWPLDKSTLFVRDLKKDRIASGKIHGTWTLQAAPAKLGFTPLALGLTGLSSWIDLGDFADSCVTRLSRCPDGFSASFKANVGGIGTGYFLSSVAFNVSYVDETVHFVIQDKEKAWKVKGSYVTTTWQTFAMSWSRANGLTVAIIGDASSKVLYDPVGRTVTPSAVSYTFMTIGRPNNEKSKYAEVAIRDVALWEEEISEDRMTKLHVCDNADTCASGWEYFDGSCYKVISSNLSSSEARNSCLNETADLVKITSVKENSFVKSLAQGEAWIGLKKNQDDGMFYWKDGVQNSFNDTWKSGSPGSDSCVVMESNGTWRDVLCSNTSPKYVCEQVHHHYLGCYEDNASSPSFIFNPGGYKPSSMTPGLCMHACGYWYFRFAALKSGNLCLCSNSTSPADERASDMCSVPCLGSGEQKCGGDVHHISVYKSVQVRPLQLEMSSDESVSTLSVFNITFTPTLPDNQTVEYYTTNVGDGSIYHTTQPFASIVILHPGKYDIRGRAVVKHSKTGYRSAVESSVNVTAVSSLTDLEVFCPACAPINYTVSCSVKFQYGSDVDALVHFDNGKNPVSGSLPDAAVMTWGFTVGESGSPVTSDGLYLMAAMTAASKGEVAALEMDLAQGGGLEIQVFRPKCVDSGQQYCSAQKMCISNFTLCSQNAAKSCENEKTFSFAGGPCSAQNLSCCQNKTLAHGNFDYEKFSGFAVYTTGGPKRILIENKTERLHVEPGDVFGVRFPASGPAAVLKTNLAGSSLFYPSSVLNRTNSSILRLPSSEDSPTQSLFAPAIALIYSVDSESKLENVYESVGQKNVVISIANSKSRVNYTKSICLQETITGLQLDMPEALPYAETVNLTVNINQGSNVTYMWDFGDKSNTTSMSPWATHVYQSVGNKSVSVLAGNNVGLMTLWCSVVIQERISGLKFKNDSLLAIENGTTARIGWMLFNGSHVDFNITITSPDGTVQATNLTNAKAPAARFFALYKKNLTVPGWHQIQITATNKVNNETITGNLSVQLAVNGVAMDYPKILKTNQTFNFTILSHQGETMARYSLKTMDGKTIKTTDKVIPYTYTTAGRYKVSLIAANDISAVVVNCAEIVVQDVIEGLQYTSFNHTVAVRAESEIFWRITQGSELYLVINYGDGISKIVNRSVSVSSIFVAVSKHNYTKPGDYLVTINATNLVDSQTINTTVHVETPGNGSVLAVGRGNLTKAEAGPCSSAPLYVKVNDSVTVTATIVNGTNLNVALNFGDGSWDRRLYFHRQFPDEGWTSHHLYSLKGEYNITVTFNNRNPQNVSHSCLIIVQYPVSVVEVASNSPKPSSNSTITLNVSFPGYTPSGPLSYNWLHGDNTSQLVQENSMGNHSYPNRCGVYIATVNVSNKVSYGFGMAEIVIQDEIQGLKYFANYTELNDQCSDFQFNVSYKVFPLDYDVAFNASITNGTNATFLWSFLRDDVDCPGMRCRHMFKHTGQNKVRITVKNNVSEKTEEFNITLDESIRNVSLENDGPTEQEKPVNFTLAMDQVGNHSCFKVDFSDELEKKYLKSGTPSAFCQTDTQPIEVRKNQTFAYTYNNDSEYAVILTAKNRVSCVVSRSTVAVTEGHCKPPIITIPGFKDDSTKTEFRRSEKIIIKTVNTINCFRIETEFRWEIYNICDSNKPIKITVAKKPDLEKINMSRSELILPALFFDYCKKLEVRFIINMTKVQGVSSEKKIYLAITKSPLVAIISGGSERTVGEDQLVEIDAENSKDPDVDTTKVAKYAWFCKSDSDNNYELPKNLSNLPPIPTPRPQPNKTDNSSGSEGNGNLGGCFGYGPGQLDFTSMKIKLNTTNMNANSTYVIRFVLAKDGRTAAFSDQRIKVLPGDPPSLTIECHFNCEKKLNPASKFTLLGKGKSKGNKKISYKWKIEQYSNSVCQRNEKKILSYSSTPLDSDTLVIKAGFFEAGCTYKIILSGSVPGGTPGNTVYDVDVNKPPVNGSCTVKPQKGKPLDPTFILSCKGFSDGDLPLQYQFFYTTDKGQRNQSLGSGLEPFLSKVSLPSGKSENENEIEFYATVSDRLGASATFKFNTPAKVKKKKKLTVTELKDKANGLEALTAAGNVKETANLVSSIALVMNEQTDDPQPSTDEDSKADEDLKQRKKLRAKLVNAVVDNVQVSKETSLEDLAQLSNTVGAATAVPAENSLDMTEKVSSFAEEAAKAIFEQANSSSSEKIKEASQAVFGTAVNVILSAGSSNNDKQSKEQSSQDASENVTRRALKTVDALTKALLFSKVSGEEETTLDTKSLSLGVSRDKVEKINKKRISLSGSEVVFPANFSTLVSTNSSLERVSMVSATNLYSGGAGADKVKSKLVSLSFYESNNEGERKDYPVEDLQEEDAISVIIPRIENEEQGDDEKQPNKLYSEKEVEHTFNITDNSSAVIIRVEWEVDVEVELYVRKGYEPKPAEGIYDFNATLKRGGHSVVNTSNEASRQNASEFFLSNDALNWTAEGTYFATLRFKDNGSLPAEEKAKMTPDGAVLYNFSVLSSVCRYFDEKKNAWSTKGTKVGPKTCREFTECLTTHLTTFGSSFFVPPNKINFKELSVDKLLDSPHALITVCVILGLYLICLIPARRADRNDALKTGVTPLPDNDSRDTYCYEIQVHTGFARGAGTSAEISIVLTGGLGDSEPRALKDPNRKNFKTGSVDPFLLTVPQSLGNLKHIRIWHNNGGSYPSWNLLRVMIQDIQTDQRWWFVCDDWLAVDESDGKIERTLYPASKKELTKFNVLFTSEVRKNLTDGHIWFSVVTRPPRSTFTRVQRLTCCLSILMTTMVANAMFYEVGKYETPKNAIRIMGFSFSIRQVSIGIMSGLVVFPINLIIVTIFRKVKPKENHYTVKTESASTDVIDVEAGEEKDKMKKPPAKFALPRGFVYVAYGIAFLATCTSGTFVILYGMEFGPEKSAQWLSSMTISFLQDVLFTQPIKVFALATLFALLIKDPKKAEQDSFTDANALANDEEWLHKKAEDLDEETQQELKQLINDKPPDEAKLEIARKLRMKEKQMKSIIREIVWYAIFLLVLLTISYGNRDLTTSKVTGYMQNIFEKAAYSGNLTFKKVHEINQYWQWVNDTFIPSLLPQFYYDNSTSYDSGYIADIPTAWLLGVARLRQLRIRKDTCTFKRFFLHFIHECNDFYSIAEEDKGSYLPEWKHKPLIPYQNLSVEPATTPTTEHPGKGPWDFQTGEELETYPYWGYKATYSAGGYVQALPKGEAESKEVVGNLSANNWMDRYTRAIFSEFAIYNANVNLFCVVTLLFEQLPTGSLTPYPSILTLRLFRYVGGEMYFVLTCEIVYLLFCAFFVFKEIRLFIKKGREHLKSPWSILEIVLTLLSLSAVGLYFARMTFTNKALKSMQENGTGFVSFHYTAFLDEWLKCIMGVIVFLSFLKMFRLLRFNRRMSMLQQVLKRCFGQLLSFMVMFAFAFLAYALLASLVFGQSMEGFGTFWRSCASLMDTLLGKFTLKAMVTANRIIGPIFFYSYTVSMVFILINMFVSIINDAFTEVRSDVEKQSNDYEIVDFMIHRLKENIGKTMGHAIHPVYKEPKCELELNFDKIADNADNAMHFMRNIAFEDMRKTRWFQTDTCTEKKKNLMRLLMEVDWDFYEAELCDSIPVFERFLSQRSEEELEDILQYYQQKRMVEDIVFNQVNGEEDSSAESDSGSDNSDGSNSEDEKSSNDESDSENEPVAEDGTSLLTRSLGNTSWPGSAVKVKSPALLVTDSEKETTESQQFADDTSRKGSFVEEAASDVELLKILEDVRREQESRCATDAELDSIIFNDALSDDVKPSRCNSDPETIIGFKNGAKKKRKKKQEAVKVEEATNENTIKEAWITIEEKNAGDGEPKVSEKKKKKKVAKETNLEKRDLEQGNDETDEREGKPEKKNKRKVVSGVEQEMDLMQNQNNDLEIAGNSEGKASEETGKMKKKRKKNKSETTEEDGKNDPIEDEDKKKKESESPNQGGTSGEMAGEEIDDDEGQRKKKKKRNKETAAVSTTEENSEEKTTEMPKKKKKKTEATGENVVGEEKTDENEETAKKKKKKKKLKDEINDIPLQEETLEVTDLDQAVAKKKKKGKAKKQLALEGDDGQPSVQSDETEEAMDENKGKRKTSLEEESQC